ncbi:MAG: DNA repair protein RadC [Clostridia bacterium]|nr:DNA repair protein RadC [Clostridia bacterium]
MDKLSIKDIPLEDRPYEKFEKYGSLILTDAELLAIVIKSGSKELNSVDVARLLLSKHESGYAGFKYLEEASLEELMKVRGIGKVKAIQIKAVLEIAKRINSNKLNETKIKITSPKQVYDMLSSELKDAKVEHVKVILLDAKSHVKSVITVCIGMTNKSMVSPKEILSEPIKQLASSIVLVHNHPSGDTTPSRQDILLTKKIIDYATIFDITLLDHVIIGANGYTSIKETNNSLFIGGRIL